MLKSDSSVDAEPADPEWIGVVAWRGCRLDHVNWLQGRVQKRREVVHEVSGHLRER